MNSTTDDNIITESLHAKSSYNKSLTTTGDIRRNLPQILAVLVKNVLLMGLGMTLGFPTILIGGLEDSKDDFQLTEEELSWIGAINLIFVPVGCLASGPYCEKFGRKKAMQMANVPLACIWLIFRYSSSVWHLYFGLAGIGILLGLLEAPVITYITEITTPNLRGILFAFSTLFIIIGTLCCFFLGSIYYWRSVAQIAFILPLICINLLFLIPESPHWLIKKGKHEEAKKSLAWLRGWVSKDAIHQEYTTLNNYINQGCSTLSSNTNTSLTSVTSNLVSHNNPPKPCINFTSPNFLKPYALISTVFFIRHFSGITNIQTYAVEIFEEVHSPMNKYKATVIMGFSELIGAITCTCLIRKLGKRKLTFGAMIMSMFCLLTIPLYNYGCLDKKFNWIPMAGLLGNIYFAHCSLRTLPWILVGEFYPPQIRAIASGISAATGYFFGFVVNKLFYWNVSLLTLNGLFIMYVVVLLIGVVVLSLTLPETEGKTLDEICAYFSKDSNVCINERNNNKDLSKQYACSYRNDGGNDEEENLVSQGHEENENHGNNKMANDVEGVKFEVVNLTRRNAILESQKSEDYTISIDRLDSNLNCSSYKRFDEVFTEF